jgi:hypothetical protein
MNNLNSKQINGIVEWLESWSVIKGTIIPSQFREVAEKKGHILTGALAKEAFANYVSGRIKPVTPSMGGYWFDYDKNIFIAYSFSSFELFQEEFGNPVEAHKYAKGEEATLPSGDKI